MNLMLGFILSMGKKGADYVIKAPKIVGIVYKHGEEDFSVWLPELTKSENEQLNFLLEKNANGGCSTRGTKQNVLEELKDFVD